MLFDPDSHERLTEAPWDEARARDAIAAIAADAEVAFDDETLWPVHPLDEDDDDPEPLLSPTGLYLGAAGVVWALDELAEVGGAEPSRDWRPVAAGLHERYLGRPDFGDAVPGLLAGESGILLVAHRLAPSAEQEERLLACVRTNVDNPARELLWGSPGTMLAAQVMLERTGDDSWADAWRESADRLWDEWREELWQQELHGDSVHYLGPVHGFVGNVYVLARGSLLDDERRAELERRTVAAIAAHARREDGLAQWPPGLEPPSRPQAVRTQWCHGAPGIVTSLASLAPGDDELTELLAAGGELTWLAGPLAKGPGLCHGTAGNGYAFLQLLERTADELWLDRARAFAMHAAEQVERMRRTHGRGRYSLWTGDVGAALYLWSCIAASAALPTLDRW
ncbi:MAG TPA: LanC-like protein [Gaiellaceae bacterium]